MSKNNYNERRDSVRVKRIVTVRHRLHRRDNKKREDVWQLSTTEDMSYSGLLFSSILPYKLGDTVELQVVMSGVLYLFNGYGKVVRISEKQKGVFLVAVKYADLKTRHRDAKSLIDVQFSEPRNTLQRKSAKTFLKSK